MTLMHKEKRLIDTDAKLELEQFLAQLRRSRRSALLLDYDGTLAPFQSERDQAIPYPGISTRLTEIMNTGHTRVVIVSGRRAHEVISLLGIDPHPEIWGAHGLQRLHPDGSCEMPRLDEIADEALAEADAWIEGLGFHHLAEHKPGGLALHWRGLPADEQAEMRKIALLGWLPIAHRACAVLQEFDGGVEIRVSDRNKGDAVRTVLSEIDRETPVAYLGDDETDEDAFAALADRGLRILVRPEYRETAADVWLRPPAELELFLCDWLEACQCAQRQPLRRAC